MQACINRKVLTNGSDLTSAFNILDSNKDGIITLEDFDNMFSSHGTYKMDTQIWNDLLKEADTNGDGVVSFDEFILAMGSLLNNNLKK